jgi:branched-chain amino acid transport system ATP-binding protein
MLSLRRLNTFYGRAHILFDLELEVGEGEVVVLLGRNGAGKSTTLKTIIGLARAASGEIDFRGRAIQGLMPYEISRLGIGYVPEERRIFTDLTVMENLEVGRQPSRPGMAPWTPARLFELFPNLAEMRGRRGGMMSGGEQQMLTIARTLMGNPLLILLDEPSEGLAPKIVEEMAATVRRLKQEGLAVLLSEQNLYFAGHVADRAVVIEKGRVRSTGSMRDLLGNETMQRAYLSA